MKALVPNMVYLLRRKNKRLGGYETTTYIGSLKLKPRGWSVVRKL